MNKIIIINDNINNNINDNYLEHFNVYFNMLLTCFFNHFHISKKNNSSIFLQNIQSVSSFDTFIQSFPINYLLLDSFYKQLHQQILFLEDNSLTFTLSSHAITNFP